MKKKMKEEERDSVRDKQKPRNHIADDVVHGSSKMFPNFMALTQEEKLAFFAALNAARQKVLNSGKPINERFGTVHDEYLKYIELNCNDAETEGLGDSLKEGSSKTMPSSCPQKLLSVDQVCSLKSGEGDDGQTTMPAKTCLGSPNSDPIQNECLVGNVSSIPRRKQIPITTKPVKTIFVHTDVSPDSVSSPSVTPGQNSQPSDSLVGKRKVKRESIKIKERKERRDKQETGRQMKNLKTKRPREDNLEKVKKKSSSRFPIKIPSLKKKESVQGKTVGKPQQVKTEPKLESSPSKTSKFESLKAGEKEIFFATLKKERENNVREKPRETNSVLSLNDMLKQCETPNEVSSNDCASAKAKPPRKKEACFKGKGNNYKVKVIITSLENEKMKERLMAKREKAKKFDRERMEREKAERAKGKEKAKKNTCSDAKKGSETTQRKVVHFGKKQKESDVKTPKMTKSKGKVQAETNEATEATLVNESRNGKSATSITEKRAAMQGKKKMVSQRKMQKNTSNEEVENSKKEKRPRSEPVRENSQTTSQTIEMTEDNKQEESSIEDMKELLNSLEEKISGTESFIVTRKRIEKKKEKPPKKESLQTDNQDKQEQGNLNEQATEQCLSSGGDDSSIGSLNNTRKVKLKDKKESCAKEKRNFESEKVQDERQSVILTEEQEEPEEQGGLIEEIKEESSGSMEEKFSGTESFIVSLRKSQKRQDMGSKDIQFQQDNQSDKSAEIEPEPQENVENSKKKGSFIETKKKTFDSEQESVLGSDSSQASRRNVERNKPNETTEKSKKEKGTKTKQLPDDTQYVQYVQIKKENPEQLEKKVQKKGILVEGPKEESFTPVQEKVSGTESFILSRKKIQKSKVPTIKGKRIKQNNQSAVVTEMKKEKQEQESSSQEVKSEPQGSVPEKEKVTDKESSVAPQKKIEKKKQISFNSKQVEQSKKSVQVEGSKKESNLVVEKTKNTSNQTQEKSSRAGSFIPSQKKIQKKKKIPTKTGHGQHANGSVSSARLAKNKKEEGKSGEKIKRQSSGSEKVSGSESRVVSRKKLQKKKEKSEKTEPKKVENKSVQAGKESKRGLEKFKKEKRSKISKAQPKKTSTPLSQKSEGKEGKKSNGKTKEPSSSSTEDDAGSVEGLSLLSWGETQKEEDKTCKKSDGPEGNKDEKILEEEEKEKCLDLGEKSLMVMWGELQKSLPAEGDHQSDLSLQVGEEKQEQETLNKQATDSLVSPMEEVMLGEEFLLLSLTEIEKAKETLPESEEVCRNNGTQTEQSSGKVKQPSLNSIKDKLSPKVSSKIVESRKSTTEKEEDKEQTAKQGEEIIETVFCVEKFQEEEEEEEEEDAEEEVKETTDSINFKKEKDQEDDQRKTETEGKSENQEENKTKNPVEDQVVKVKQNPTKRQTECQTKNQAEGQMETPTQNQNENQPEEQNEHQTDQIKDPTENQEENQQEEQNENQANGKMKKQTENQSEGQMKEPTQYQNENQPEKQNENQIENQKEDQTNDQIEDQAIEEKENQTDQGENQTKGQTEEQKEENTEEPKENQTENLKEEKEKASNHEIKCKSCCIQSKQENNCTKEHKESDYTQSMKTRTGTKGISIQLAAEISVDKHKIPTKAPSPTKTPLPTKSEKFQTEKKVELKWTNQTDRPLSWMLKMEGKGSPEHCYPIKASSRVVTSDEDSVLHLWEELELLKLRESECIMETESMTAQMGSENMSESRFTFLSNQNSQHKLNLAEEKLIVVGSENGIQGKEGEGQREAAILDLLKSEGVIVVDGDAIEKLKSLVEALEREAAEAEGKTKPIEPEKENLENEYSQLLFEYIDYLTRLLDTLTNQREQTSKARVRGAFPGPDSYPEFVKSTEINSKKKPRFHSYNKLFDNSTSDETQIEDNEVEWNSSSSFSESPTTTTSFDDNSSLITTPSMRKQLIEDFLKERAKFVEESIDGFRILKMPPRYGDVQKASNNKAGLAGEDNDFAQGRNKFKLFQIFSRFFKCVKKKRDEEGTSEEQRRQRRVFDSVERPHERRESRCEESEEC